MNPLKFLTPLSNWLLRIAVLLLVYIIYFLTFRHFNYDKPDFWIACGFGLFAILLFIGGFMKKHGMTVVPAIFLFAGCCYEIFMHYFYSKGRFVAIFAIFAAVAIYFTAYGNRTK